jgi:hypothetical protein
VFISTEHHTFLERADWLRGVIAAFGGGEKPRGGPLATLNEEIKEE